MAKIPGNTTGSNVAAYHVIKHLFKRCRYCQKAFSTREYRLSHEQRRHSDQLSNPDQDGEAITVKLEKDSKQSSEITRLTNLIETLTNSFTKPNEKDQQNELILQEKLKFEKEIQDVKAKMHLQLEEEMSHLREERAMFSKLIVIFKSYQGFVSEADASCRKLGR